MQPTIADYAVRLICVLHWSKLFRDYQKYVTFNRLKHVLQIARYSLQAHAQHAVT